MQKKFRVEITPYSISNNVRLTETEARNLLGFSQIRFRQWIKDGRIVPGKDKLFGNGDILSAAITFTGECWNERVRGAVRQAEQHAGLTSERLKKFEKAGDRVGIVQAQIDDLRARTRASDLKSEREAIQIGKEKGELVVTKHIMEVFKGALVGQRVELERLPKMLARECFGGDRVKYSKLLKRLDDLVRSVLNQAADEFEKAGRKAWLLEEKNARKNKNAREDKDGKDGEETVKKVKKKRAVKKAVKGSEK